MNHLTAQKPLHMHNKPQKSNKEFVSLLLPAVATLFIITIFPLIYGVGISFSSIPKAGSGEAKFIGFTNYVNLFKRVEFASSVVVTIKYVVVAVILSIVFGFALAVLMNRDIIGKKLILGLFILPVVTTPVVSGLMWKFMFSGDLGIINYFLSILGIPPVFWLSKPMSALIVMLVVDLWQWTPFCMFLLLAGLQNIPISTIEASKLDGASTLQTFWYITFKQMVPITSIVVLFRLMDSFKAFDHIFVITQGGPGRATQTLNLLAYFIGFRYSYLGMAAALGLVILIFIIVVSQLLLRFFAETAGN